VSESDTSLTRLLYIVREHNQSDCQSDAKRQSVKADCHFAVITQQATAHSQIYSDESLTDQRRCPWTWHRRFEARSPTTCGTTPQRPCRTGASQAPSCRREEECSPDEVRQGDCCEREETFLRRDVTYSFKKTIGRKNKESVSQSVSMSASQSVRFQYLASHVCGDLGRPSRPDATQSNVGYSVGSVRS
jgi:hypothetical protein